MEGNPHVDINKKLKKKEIKNPVIRRFYVKSQRECLQSPLGFFCVRALLLIYLLLLCITHLHYGIEANTLAKVRKQL